MKCSTCGKSMSSTDRRRRYCSAKCRDNKGKRRHLRAVEPDEPSSALQPRTLAVDEAARDGSDLELLMAMRDRVAETVADPNCPPRDLAALTRRLEELRKQIAAERLRLKEELADAEAVDDETWDEASI